MFLPTFVSHVYRTVTHEVVPRTSSCFRRMYPTNRHLNGPMRNDDGKCLARDPSWVPLDSASAEKHVSQAPTSLQVIHIFLGAYPGVACYNTTRDNLFAPHPTHALSSRLLFHHGAVSPFPTTFRKHIYPVLQTKVER